MATKKRALAALAALVVLAVPAAAAARAGGPASEGRVGAWDRPLVLPQKVSARLSWAERRLQPSGLRELDRMARTLAPEITAGTDFMELRKQAELRVIASYPGLSAMDVSEAAFIVMAMAVKDMDDDIRMIMAEIKAMEAAKKELREMIKKLGSWIAEEMSKGSGSKDIDHQQAAGSRATASASRRMTFETRISPLLHLEYAKAPVVTPLPPRNPGLTAAALNSVRADVEGNLDSLGELSEEISLRLQIAMERRAKIIQTLSNIIKKISQTQETLVQNIK